VRSTRKKNVCDQERRNKLKERGVQVARFPIPQHWSKEKVWKREREEGYVWKKERRGLNLEGRGYQMDASDVGQGGGRVIKLDGAKVLAARGAQGSQQRDVIVNCKIE